MTQVTRFLPSMWEMQNEFLNPGFSPGPDCTAQLETETVNGDASLTLFFFLSQINQSINTKNKSRRVSNNSPYNIELDESVTRCKIK